MKTAIVISDTHGNVKDLLKLVPLMRENDYVFHLGDGENDLDTLPEDVRKKVINVSGNCDLSLSESEKVIEIEGVKIFLTHGHRYGVKSTPYKLLLKGREIGANICFYGHSHRASIELIDGVYLVNPGNLTRYSTEKTFCYCVFSDGKVTPTINKTFFSV